MSDNRVVLQSGSTFAMDDRIYLVGTNRAERKLYAFSVYSTVIIPLKAERLEDADGNWLVDLSNLKGKFRRLKGVYVTEK